jgi:hypothetical protein
MSWILRLDTGIAADLPVRRKTDSREHYPR